MSERSDEDKIKELLRKKSEIDEELRLLSKKKLEKYINNKEEVKEDNPYSRLFALKKMKIVPNYEEFTKKTAVIIGVGGVGSVLSEMYVRMGIGKLILYDYDNVELANMNRLFYTPLQAGLPKVKAAAETLSSISEGTQVVTHNVNITSSNCFEDFIAELKMGGLDGKQVDILFCCVDNYSARMAVSTACNAAQISWFESGVSEDALSAHIQLIVPGETACFACMPPLAFVENTENLIKREGVCTASLPTTMALTAALLAQNGLKYLLEFENSSLYARYNSRDDSIEKSQFVPNPECLDRSCREQQQRVLESKKKLLEEKFNNVKLNKEHLQPLLESTNLAEEYGIEVIENLEKEEIKPTADIRAKDSKLEDLFNELDSL